MTGKELKEKLESSGIPLRKIAERLGITEQNLQNKMAAADIKVSFLCQVSKVLHKSVYFLLDGQDFYTEEPTSNSALSTQHEGYSGEARAYYTMYKEEKKENRLLIEEVGTLKERLRQLEDGGNTGKSIARPASSTQSFSKETFAGSASAPSKTP